MPSAPVDGLYPTQPEPIEVEPACSARLRGQEEEFDLHRTRFELPPGDEPGDGRTVGRPAGRPVRLVMLVALVDLVELGDVPGVGTVPALHDGEVQHAT